MTVLLYDTIARISISTYITKDSLLVGYCLFAISYKSWAGGIIRITVKLQDTHSKYTRQDGIGVLKLK